jgi:hypothetical protein
MPCSSADELKQHILLRRLSEQQSRPEKMIFHVHERRPGGTSTRPAGFWFPMKI